MSTNRRPGRRRTSRRSRPSAPASPAKIEPRFARHPGFRIWPQSKPPPKGRAQDSPQGSDRRPGATRGQEQWWGEACRPAPRSGREPHGLLLRYWPPGRTRFGRSPRRPEPAPREERGAHSSRGRRPGRGAPGRCPRFGRSPRRPEPTPREERGAHSSRGRRPGRGAPRRRDGILARTKGKCRGDP